MMKIMLRKPCPYEPRFKEILYLKLLSSNSHFKLHSVFLQLYKYIQVLDTQEILLKFHTHCYLVAPQTSQEALTVVNCGPFFTPSSGATVVPTQHVHVALAAPRNSSSLENLQHVLLHGPNA